MWGGGGVDDDDDDIRNMGPWCSPRIRNTWIAQPARHFDEKNIENIRICIKYMHKICASLRGVYTSYGVFDDSRVIAPKVKNVCTPYYYYRNCPTGEKRKAIYSEILQNTRPLDGVLVLL